MRPIRALERERARALRGLLFDLDDTVLDHGRLTRAAFDALERLGESDLLLVGVTGRPAAWAQALVRQWPVTGMIAENGNIAVNKVQDHPYLMDRLDARERRAQTDRLRELVAEIQSRWPELELDDGLGRLSDVAFDVAERRQVPADVVRAVMQFAQERGARTTLSSIHLHATFDPDDKATGALRYLSVAHGLDPTECCRRFAYIGDSGNDAPAFAAFDCSIAVANLRGRWTRPPAFVTSEMRGKGFREASTVLLDLRR